MRLLRSAYNNNLPMYLTISSEIPLVEDAIIIFTSRILSSFINTCYTPRSNVHDSDRNIYIYITVSFNRKPCQPRFLVSLLFPPFHHRSNDHDLARYAKSIFLRIIVHSIDPLIYRMIHGPIRGFIGSVIQRQRIQEIDQTFGEKKSARRNGSARVNGVNEHRLAWGHGFYRPRSPF